MPIVVSHKTRIQLLPLRELMPHEEILPRRAVELREIITREKIVKKPIIVEEKTLTIIDGHHRYTILRSMGAKLAPVVLARYHKDIEKIESRPYTIPVEAANHYNALAMIEEHIRSMAKKGPSIIILDTANERIVFRRDLKDVYKAIKTLGDRRKDPANNPVVEIRIIPPPLAPKEILSTAIKGDLLPPKTTIHKTKLKEVNANIKLKCLF